MDDTTSDEPISIGAFSPPEAKRLLAELVAAGIEPQIEVDDGIRNVGLRFGSAGSKAKVEVFVWPDALQKACSIRDAKLKLTGET